ncbi:hypothetical protein N7486_000741, partial [Penicillium sp. IBT 16267x]
CEKVGLECFSKRPFRWVKGVAIRGKMRGRLYEKVIRSSDPVGAIPRTQNSLFSEVWYFGEQPAGCITSPALTEVLDNNRIYKLFIVYDSDSNPFRSLIPYGLEDLTRHYANTGQSFNRPNTLTHPRFVKAQNDALLFKAQAI